MTKERKNVERKSMICIPHIAEKRIVKHEIVGEMNREFYWKRHLMNFVRRERLNAKRENRFSD